mmetsp:Transcript_16200/g.23431  ORF Transcript_16200/g.23431 Transcript_16200/m.23431 type:complete len:199 (-) Transcript_16200:333-929(-)
MSRHSLNRLRKEYEMIQRDPPPNAIALPEPGNMLNWHFVIFGLEDPYRNGVYHGELRFPVEYPMAPPSILMHTPSGRFETGKRICTSMSDYHPESWSPIWKVSTILTGFVSFMLSEERSAGTTKSSLQEKRKYAAQSVEFNCSNEKFMEMFQCYFDKILPKTPETFEEPPKPNRNFFVISAVFVFLIAFAWVNISNAR